MPKLKFPLEAFEELRERPDYEDLMEESRKLVHKASGRPLSEDEETHLAEEGALVAICLTEPGTFHYWNHIKPGPGETTWPEGYFESWEPIGDDFQIPERLQGDGEYLQEPPSVG